MRVERQEGEMRLRGTDVHWQEIDGELIALEARASTYLAANEPGTLLWRALATGSTRSALAAKLVEHYGIEFDRALADTDAFIAQVAAHGLLETDDGRAV
jgi:Coenzyme PQQ synthesis protein D (PqqD)